MQPTKNRAVDARVPPATTIRLRRPTTRDGAAMWELAQGAVDENSPYAYLMFAEYFADSCVLAERDGRAVGFVTGFRRPDEPCTQFVWQVVVGADARGEGLGSRLLEAAVEGTGVHRPATHLEATVNPTNTASQRLFRSFAERHGALCDERLLLEPDDFPAAAGNHEAEICFRIGPLANNPNLLDHTDSTTRSRAET